MSRLPDIAIPELDDFENPAVVTDPRVIREELEQLPVLNLARSIKTVIDGVRPANTQRIPARQRLRLLETYRDTVTQLYQGSEDNALRKLPLGKSGRKDIRQQMTRMLEHLGNGYKVLLQQTHQDESSDIHHTALYRALETAGLALLHAYRCYASPRKGLLREIHQLYLYARNLGIDDNEVHFERQRISNLGIGLLYRQLMLLCVSDPYRFPVNAASHVFRFLEQFAVHCKLSASESDLHPENFLIDLENDQPPWPLHLGMPREYSQYLLVFDIRDSLAYIRDRIDSRDSRDTDRLTAHMEDLLARQFRQPRRRNKHLPGNYPVQVTVGFDNIAALLDDGDAPGESWTVVNESAGGLCLQCGTDICTDLRVGELIAITPPSSPTLLATIQWMRETDGMRSTGVEVVPGKPVPASCHAEDRPKVDHKVMLMPEAPAVGLPATIVAPFTLYQPDRILHMDTGRGTFSVRCMNIVRESTLVQIFSYSDL